MHVLTRSDITKELLKQFCDESLNQSRDWCFGFDMREERAALLSPLCNRVLFLV